MLFKATNWLLLVVLCLGCSEAEPPLPDGAPVIPPGRGSAQREGDAAQRSPVDQPGR